MKTAAALQVLFFLRKLMVHLISSKVMISIQWARKKRKHLWISRIYKAGESERYLQKTQQLDKYLGVNKFHKIIYETERSGYE